MTAAANKTKTSGKWRVVATDAVARTVTMARGNETRVAEMGSLRWLGAATVGGAQ